LSVGRYRGCYNLDENSGLSEARVKEYERQLDQLVYQLYDLTPEEIAVVEGSQ